MGGMLVAGLIVGGLLKASAKTIREDTGFDSGTANDDRIYANADSLDSPSIAASQTGSSL